MAPRPETLTCCLSQAGIPSALLKADQVEEVKSAVRRRAKVYSGRECGVNELLHVFSPIVKLLKQETPGFSSAPFASRLNFWRSAADVALGRAGGAAVFKKLLKDDKIMATVDEKICLEFAELLKVPGSDGAKRRRVEEPAEPASASSSSLSDLPTSSPTSSRLKQTATVQRHAHEMDNLNRQCQEDERLLQEEQKKAMEMLATSYKSMISFAFQRAYMEQREQLMNLREKSRQRLELLRAQHLSEFFAPFLHISFGKEQMQHPCQGFYELSPEHTDGWQPVYRRYMSKPRHYLYLSKRRWWISTEPNMKTRQDSGLVHSGLFRANDSPARPETASCWKIIGPEKKWETIDLKFQELKEAQAEFVVVSMAGTELLRKTLPLNRTVRDLKVWLQSCNPTWMQPVEFIRLCLGSQELEASKELGRLGIAAEECLQAIMMPISCKECEVSLVGDLVLCWNCDDYLCSKCKEQCRFCEGCGMQICRECADECEYHLYGDIQLLCDECAEEW